MAHVIGRKHDLLLYLKGVIYPKRWEILRLYSPRLNTAQNPREWYISRSRKELDLKSKVRCWSKEKYASTVIYVWRFTQVFLRILLLRDLHCVSSKHPPVRFWVTIHLVIMRQYNPLPIFLFVYTNDEQIFLCELYTRAAKSPSSYTQTHTIICQTNWLAFDKHFHKNYLTGEY